MKFLPHFPFKRPKVTKKRDRRQGGGAGFWISRNLITNSISLRSVNRLGQIFKPSMQSRVPMKEELITIRVTTCKGGREKPVNARFVVECIPSPCTMVILTPRYTQSFTCATDPPHAGLYKLSEDHWRSCCQGAQKTCYRKRFSRPKFTLEMLDGQLTIGRVKRKEHLGWGKSVFWPLVEYHIDPYLSEGCMVIDLI